MACRGSFNLPPNFETSSSTAIAQAPPPLPPLHLPSSTLQNASRLHHPKPIGLLPCFVSTVYPSAYSSTSPSAKFKVLRLSCNASAASSGSSGGLASRTDFVAGESSDSGGVLFFVNEESSTRSPEDLLSPHPEDLLSPHPEVVYSKNALGNESILSDSLRPHAASKSSVTLIKKHGNSSELGAASMHASASSCFNFEFSKTEVPGLLSSGLKTENFRIDQSLDGSSFLSFPHSKIFLECPCSNLPHAALRESDLTRCASSATSWVDIFKVAVLGLSDDKEKINSDILSSGEPSRGLVDSEEDESSAKADDIPHKKKKFKLLHGIVLSSHNSTAKSIEAEAAQASDMNDDSISNRSSDEGAELSIDSVHITRTRCDFEERIAWEMERKRTNAREFTPIARAMTWALRGVKNVSEVDNLLQGFKFPLSVFSSALQKLGKEKNPEAAVALFHWLFLRSQRFSKQRDLDQSNSNSEIATSASSDAHASEIQLNVYVYNSLLGALKATNELESMTEVVDLMANENISPDVVTFNTLLSVMEKKGLASPAFSLLHCMHSSRIKPDIFTYMSLIRICKKKGMVEDALGIYEHMSKSHSPDSRNQHLHAELTNEIRQMCMIKMRQLGKACNNSSHNHSQAHDGDRNSSAVDSVLVLFWGVHHAGLELCSEMYRTAITACCHHPERHQDSLRKILSQMRRSGITPDANTYLDSIRALGIAKKWWAALEVYEHMQEPDPRARQEITRQFHTLLNSAKKRKLWKWSLQLINRMVTSGVEPDLYCWRTVLSTCASANQTESAVEVFDMMMAWGYRPDTFAYGCLLSALEKGGLTERVEEVWQHMRDVNVQCNAEAYTTLISAYGKKGDYDKAVYAFECMVQNSIDISVVTYNAMITVCVCCGRASDALQWLQQMKEKGVDPNAVTYQQVIRALAKEGRWSEAMDAYEELKSRGLIPTAKTEERMKLVCSSHGVSFESFSVMQEKSLSPVG